ncbi:hypothetical protein TNIN_158011 [Trichonephila inaurata madagascariensis]|uniref:Pre-C2HC domain-containing protein n=1 Tax=Trichonephila inaurata madagascariensis TaxID=2747483 RepID=A0A8X6I5D7_9ARAC|nr:hypothetical protein TNIN_158011 [Trichonephila inaurata madagascariensis]
MYSSPVRILCSRADRKTTPESGHKKGLPISPDIEDIKKELTERGFDIIKVAQLTKAKTKFKLPFFLVQLKKSPDSPDIFKLEECCCLSIKVDTFNRRQGPTQTSH